MPLPEYPLKVENLLCQELEGLDEVVYVQPEDGATFSLNPTAAAILDLCDGSRTPDDLAAILHDTLGVTMETARADVAAILAEFVDYGLIYMADDDTEE